MRLSVYTLRLYFVSLLIFGVLTLTHSQGTPEKIYFKNSSGAIGQKKIPGNGVGIFVLDGDSIVASSIEGMDEEERVIVQLRQKPLSLVKGMKEKFITSELHSALSSLQTDHEKFRQDLAALDALTPQSPGATPSSSATKVRYEYKTALNGFALITSKSVVEELRKLPYVANIYEDGVVSAIDDSSNAVIGAQAFWGAYSTHGEGIDIGIIDTGIDYLHEALGGASFPNSKVVGGYDIVNNDTDPMDDNGHGTHVAGIVAGYGPPPVNLRGVAYNARLWAFKVLNAQGVGQVSDVIEGIERALDPDGDPSTPTPIKVISMSLGGSGNPNDALSTAVDNAVQSGMICVVAAGNSGPGYMSIISPGCARQALTVGATNNSDGIASFSSRGPSSNIFGIKPDILAPGVQINSAKIGGGYIMESGTSMATPHVAGAAALLQQLHPSWTPDEIKAVLMEGASDLGLDVFTQGSGRLDVFHSAAESTVVAPATLSFGLDDPSQTTWTQIQTLKFYNTRSVAESFTLTTQAAPTNGINVFFDPQVVNVPSNDTASVQVTLSVDNNLYPYPKNNPPAFSDKIIAQSMDQTDNLTIPFAFLRYSVINLKLDRYPALVIVHNGRNDSLYNRSFFGTITDSTSIVVRPDTDDIIVQFRPFVPNTVNFMTVIRERVPVAGVASVSIQSTEARDSVAIHTLDAVGKEFTSYNMAAEVIQRNQSRFQVFTVTWGDTFHVKRSFADFSPAYYYEISLLPGLSSTNGAFYEFPFQINNGINSPTIFQNNPTLFKRVDYHCTTPPSVNSILLSSVLVNGSFGLGSYLGQFYSPFTMSAWYLPTPENFEFRYTQHEMWADSINYNSRPLYTTGTVVVPEPDTMKFLWSPWDFYGQPPKFVSERSMFNNGLGSTIPVWIGQIFHEGSRIDMEAFLLSYFISPLGDQTSADLHYQLYGAGSIIDSGVIGNMPSYLNEWFSVPFNPYDLRVFFNQYKIGAFQGLARAKITGSSNNGSPQPPYIRNLQLLRNGELPDSLSVNEIRLTPKSYKGLPLVNIFYRKLTDSVWLPLPLSFPDTTYIARVPDTLRTGYYSARIVLGDSLSDSLDYTIEPAFTIPGIFISSRYQVFDSVNVGCRGTSVISVHNLWQTGGVTIHSIESDDPNFEVPAIQRTMIAPSESIHCSIIFNPLSPGVKVGHIVFNYLGGFLPDTITVTGNGKGSGEVLRLSTEIGSGWQLVSLPVDPVCPYILHNLFEYRGGYIVHDTLNRGKGYWKIFSDSELIFAGFPVTADTEEIDSGWNISGSISTPLASSSVSTIPAGLLESPFWVFTSSGYEIADTIKPGHGYWVKAGHSGRLVLGNSMLQSGRGSAREALAIASSLVITDAANRSQTLYFKKNGKDLTDVSQFDSPPIPPSGVFTARFTTGRLCETFDEGKSKTIPIIFSSAKYPITIGWKLIPKSTSVSLEVGENAILLDSSGSTWIMNPVSKVLLKISGRSALPTVYLLEQSYPNPFNPTTTIQFQLPAQSHVKLGVYNLLGQVVQTLVDDIEDAGYKHVEWNASNFASGIYFYRLEATSIANPSKTFTQTKKMLLMK
jgi:subtilisin family serine protease